MAANLAALKPANIKAIGAVGNDIFGKEMLRQLQEIGVDTRSLIPQTENYNTVTFAKRYLADQEQPRIDFGFFNKRSLETDQAILAALRDALESCDAVIFNQQVPGSIPNESFIDRANELFKTYHDQIVLFDSRHYGDRFKHVYRKTNDIEAARLNGLEAALGDVIPLEQVKQFAAQLYRDSGKPVFLTRGNRGILVADGEGLHEIPGIQILKKIDTVGAGDTVISALCVALAAGVKPVEAAEFANYAAAVTVQKLFQTGTASGEEILEVCENADFIHQPELAEDIRQARYLAGTEIELCHPAETLALGRIKHAIFDHDGTISSLRQGWEQIMEPVMVKAILGSRYQTADETLYHRVVSRVREYINQSTGIQTILQMEALADMVREFGLVPAAEIRDAFGYKKIYNDALMEMVNHRLRKLQNHQLDLSDYILKGAVEFLQVLQERGVRLYLASGTDYADVAHEAKVLGYAGLFDGGIYGAMEHQRHCTKKMVMEKIIQENHLSGPELAVFGDGPVEIRQACRRDGIAVGIASDEIRRHGLNQEKRTRLIKAGAQLIIPDFSQGRLLADFLFHPQPLPETHSQAAR
ncbi:MAG: Bifunctional protein HldE [Planctomycetes bacterium ADurb.Bin412]|nr:MAG: Bifunctional protein HldE [Planctomycetes bacterium ADurb.Bin412]